MQTWAYNPKESKEGKTEEVKGRWTKYGIQGVERILNAVYQGHF